MTDIRHFTLLLIIIEMPNREDKIGIWMKVRFDLGNTKKEKKKKGHGVDKIKLDCRTDNISVTVAQMTVFVPSY